MIFLVWKTPKKYFSPNRVQTPEKTSHQKSHTQHCTKKQKLYITFHSACLDILSDVSRAHLCVKFSPLYTHSPFFLFYAAGKIVISFYYFKKKKKKVRFLLLYIRHFSLFDQSGPCAVAPGVCVYILPPLFYIVGVVLIFVSVMDVYSVRRVNIINGG